MPEWSNGIGLGPIGLVPTGVQVLFPAFFHYFINSLTEFLNLIKWAFYSLVRRVLLVVKTFKDPTSTILLEL
jgi:hypothetical protein